VTVDASRLFPLRQTGSSTNRANRFCAIFHELEDYRRRQVVVPFFPSAFADRPVVNLIQALNTSELRVQLAIAGVIGIAVVR